MSYFSAGFANDVRFGWRQFRSHRLFSAAAIAILAIGIGSSSAVFSAIYQALLKSLPYPQADRLFFVHNAFPKAQVALTGVSAWDYATIAQHKDVFESAAVYFFNDLTLTGPAAAQHVDAVNTSATLFDVLRVKPALGRVISAADDRYGAPRVLLLSDALWHGAFGSDPHVLGRTVRLNNLPYTVIGVMPPSFQFPSAATQLWIPIDLRPSEFSLLGRSEKWLQMITRLAPGVSPGQAEAALRASGATLARQAPEFYPVNSGWRFSINRFAEEKTENIRRWLYLAFGAVLCVLLVACSNVSGLLLIRGTARSGEVAIRAALGASRRRVVLQVLTETGMLALAGCAAGLALAVCFAGLLNRYSPFTARIEVWTILFAVLLTLFSTLVAGVLPALLTARGPIEMALRKGVTRSTIRNGFWRSALLTAQIAVAVTLVFIAVLLSRSLLKLTQVPAGFSTAHLWSGAVEAPQNNPSYEADQGWNRRFFQPLQQRLAALPGVEAVSGANAIPFFPSGFWTEEIHLPGRAKLYPPPAAQIAVVLPGFFETLQIPLLRGRVFTPVDSSASQPVAIVNQQLANQYFPGEDPIGKSIRSGGQETTPRIVGVVGDVQTFDLSGPPRPQLYFPEYQERSQEMYFVIRTKTDVDITAAARATIRNLDPAVALFDVEPMSDRIAYSLRIKRFTAYLLNAFALAGLLLAAVGLFASLAHLVELRRREFGIRIALGALHKQIAALVLARAVIVISAGLAAGLSCAVGAERLLRNQLFEVSAADPVTWLLAIAAIAFFLTIAASIPALRATTLDPATALREE